jgi:hypothetical protein
LPAAAQERLSDCCGLAAGQDDQEYGDGLPADSCRPPLAIQIQKIEKQPRPDLVQRFTCLPKIDALRDGAGFFYQNYCLLPEESQPKLHGLYVFSSGDTIIGAFLSGLSLCAESESRRT